MNAPLRCDQCSAVLPLSAYNAVELMECPSCKCEVRALVFPAFLDRGETVVAETVAEDAAASCFNHPAKKATVTCEGCGRFICSLCEVELSGVHLCPQCLGSGKRKGRLSNMETQRVLYDNIALGLSLVWVFFFTIGFTLFTAPAAVFVCLRYRKAPRSIVRPGRWKWWLALIMAIAQIVGWCAIFVSIAAGKGSHGG